MKTLAYLDCPTGIAGDMCLGALVDAGVPLDYLIEQLERLHLPGEFKLRAEMVERQQQVATRIHVDLLHPQATSHGHTHGHTHGRQLPQIETLIQAAGLPEAVSAQSLAIFQQLAQAEAAVHGIAPEQVHFHEVGAVDAIVDIVGTCLGLDWLQVDLLYCSALPTGSGLVHADHGLLPVPAPAVLRLLTMAQVPVYSNGIEKELVTPTGAAIATTLATQFGAPPPLTLQKVGLGAGGYDLPIPNILRLWVGTAAEPAAASTSQLLNLTSAQTEAISQIETQLDDFSPQGIGYLYDQLFAAGAVDVFTQPVSMKKCRPGTLVTVLCPPQAAAACTAVLFRETTTLGVRSTVQQRQVLQRQWAAIATPYGEVQVKIARYQAGGEILNLQPEYEDCARLARTHGVPWKQVHQAALALGSDQLVHRSAIRASAIRASE